MHILYVKQIISIKKEVISSRNNTIFTFQMYNYNEKYIFNKTSMNTLYNDKHNWCLYPIIMKDRFVESMEDVGKHERQTF